MTNELMVPLKRPSSLTPLYVSASALVFVAEFVVPFITHLISWQSENFVDFVRHMEIRPEFGSFYAGFLGRIELNFLPPLVVSLLLIIMGKNKIARITLSLIFFIAYAVNFFWDISNVFNSNLRWAFYNFLSSINIIGFGAHSYVYLSPWVRVLLVARGVCLDVALILVVIAIIKGLKKASPQDLQAPDFFLPSKSRNAPSLAATTANHASWTVRFPGVLDQVTDTPTLKMLARSGVIRPDSFIVDNNTQVTYQARQIPGVFSDKSYTTTLLLSFFLGYLGVDRFYLGQTGLGIGKLLTFGGCGIWSFIDFILIAMHKVTDSQGNPLAK